eukprot:2224848-Prorocentrum_lima.AAC.1
MSPLSAPPLVNLWRRWHLICGCGIAVEGGCPKFRLALEEWHHAVRQFQPMQQNSPPRDWRG